MLEAPTKSMIPATLATFWAGGVSAAVPLDNQTWKPVPLMEMVPVASGVGSAVVPPDPIASCTR